jgi:hypothetical protein
VVRSISRSFDIVFPEQAPPDHSCSRRMESWYCGHCRRRYRCEALDCFAAIKTKGEARLDDGKISDSWRRMRRTPDERPLYRRG